jgi:hypothetical protein
MNSGSSAFIGSGGQSALKRRGRVVVPDVAALHPGDLAAGAAHHDTVLHAVGPVLQRLVDVGFSGTILPPRRPSSAVMTTVESQSRCGRQCCPARSRRTRPNARADARAGQHGVGRLRDHRQVDGDAVALLDAVRLQHVGEAADLVVQFAIGDVLVSWGRRLPR